MPRPKKDDKLIRHTVMVPPSTKAALVAAGAEEVREVLGSALPEPSPSQTILAAMVVGEAYTMDQLFTATGLDRARIASALGTPCRTGQVVRVDARFVRMR